MSLLDKAALRRAILAHRATLEPELLRAYSDTAAQLMLAHVPRGPAWALYAAMPHEADPATLAELAEAAGHRTLYPRIEGADLVFAAATRAELAARPAGGWGLREPEGPAEPLSTVAVVVVPGVAFDARGGRLGYGKGYYDRTIARARQTPSPPLFVGFGLSLQLVDEVPMGASDQRLDAVVTEAGWLSFRDPPV